MSQSPGQKSVPPSGLAGSAVPLALIMMLLPLNNRLLAQPPPPASDARDLLQRWSHLHAIRATVGAAGLLMHHLSRSILR